MNLRCASMLALSLGLAFLLTGCPEAPPPPAGPDAAAPGPDAAAPGPDAAAEGPDAGDDAGEDAGDDAGPDAATAIDAGKLAGVVAGRPDAALAGPDAATVAAAGPDAASAPPAGRDAATPAGPDAATAAQATVVAPTPIDPNNKAEKADSDAAIAAMRPQLDKCFIEAEMKFFGAQRITVRFTLDAKAGLGRIKDPELVTNTLRDGKSHVCFLKAFEATRFRAPTAGLGKIVTTQFAHVPSGR